jgi:hypothetical protein
MADQATFVAAQPGSCFNHGTMHRDVSYVDDVTRVVFRLIDLVPADNVAAGNAPSQFCKRWQPLSRRADAFRRSSEAGLVQGLR